MATNELPHGENCECLGCQVARDVPPTLTYKSYEYPSGMKMIATAITKQFGSWSVTYSRVWYDKATRRWEKATDTMPYIHWEKYSHRQMTDNRGANNDG